MEINLWEIIKKTLPLLLDWWPIWVFLLALAGVRLAFYWLGLEIDNWHIQKKFGQAKACPQCGGKIVKRSGKFGEFYGCNTYPKCKYTAPL